MIHLEITPLPGAPDHQDPRGIWVFDASLAALSDPRRSGDRPCSIKNWFAAFSTRSMRVRHPYPAWRLRVQPRLTKLEDTMREHRTVIRQ